MYSFQDDYSEGAHPAILNTLLETNLTQRVGYGEDSYTREAQELIRQAIHRPQAPVFFLSGGTQANLTVIAHLLQSYEAVISTDLSHIYGHETGAIEAIGHRIIPVTSTDGKLGPQDVLKVLEANQMRPHTVIPRLVYISQSTELGTIYTRKELQELKACCESHDLILYLDGARLGVALTASDADLNLEDIAQYTDVFYIGATKNGALCGEAVVFARESLGENFDLVLKQRGALLSKGSILGIQFTELFRAGLYWELAKHANHVAQILAKGIADAGYSFVARPQTNQLFPIFPQSVVNQLRSKYLFHIWQEIEGQGQIVRFVCSWATPLDQVQELIADLKSFH